VGTYGLLNCIAIQNGAISAVVWFYEPPGGQGPILSFNGVQYPTSPANGWSPIIYVGVNGALYAGDWCQESVACEVSTPISPGWHMAVFEEWASSTSGPYYIALYLDGQFIGQTSTTNLTNMFGWHSNYPYSNIGNGIIADNWQAYPPNAGNGLWWFFNGSIAFVALYNRVLTTGDVLAIWQGNLVTSGLVAVWYGDDYNPSNGYWVSRVGGYTGAPVTSSYPPRGCIEWNSAQYSGPVGIWSSWQQC
jgi:hypothetical protein